jgi:hypothetical protein
VAVGAEHVERKKRHEYRATDATLCRCQRVIVSGQANAAAVGSPLAFARDIEVPQSTTSIAIGKRDSFFNSVMRRDGRVKLSFRGRKWRRAMDKGRRSTDGECIDSYD